MDKRKNLDLIINDIQFGRFHVQLFLLLLFPVIFSSYAQYSYIITTGEPQYRCEISECEESVETNFDSNVALNFIPISSDGEPEKCLRFKVPSDGDSYNCSLDKPLKNETVSCDNYIFKTNEKTIVTDFQLLCEENKWRRSLVGFINNVGQLFGFPLSGFFSDRFGRKTMIISGVFLASILGIIKSFTNSYAAFIICEVSESLIACGIYCAAFLLTIEFLKEKIRVVGSIVVSSFFAIGGTVMGLVMMLTEDWRLFLRILYLPGLLVLSYIWLLPESIRWLFTQGNFKEVKKIVQKMNNLENDRLSELEEMMRSKETGQEKNDQAVAETFVSPTKALPLSELLRSKLLVLRVANCSFCWITNSLVFYGLAVNSVFVSGNKYVNFMFTCLVEIPGYVITHILLKVMGRRPALCSSLAIAGVSCIAFYFTPSGMPWVKLVFSLCGKVAITASFTILFIFSSEMFPTNLRNSLMGICATIGRTGSLIAPLTPVLAAYIQPSLLFGGLSFGAAFTSLFFPETLHKPMPDTVKEAENLGSGMSKTKDPLFEGRQLKIIKSNAWKGGNDKTSQGSTDNQCTSEIS